MRKKIYYQNSYGDNLEKEFIRNGFKTSFGIFTKEFRERKPETSSLLKKQMSYVYLLLKPARKLEKLR